MPIDLLDLLIASPGDLIFFLLVFALSQAALFLCLSLQSRAQTQNATVATRYVSAAFALVLIWLVLMGLALLSLLSDLDASRYLPPLERLGMALSLLFIAWAFLSPEAQPPGARSSLWLGAATVLTLLAYLYTADAWSSIYEIGAMFNRGDQALLWSILPFGIGILGFLACLFGFNRVVDAPLKCIFFLLIALGNGWDSWQLANGELAGSYLGGARWAYLAALAMLPILTHRLIVSALDQRLASAETASRIAPIEPASVQPPGASEEPAAASSRPAESTSAIEYSQFTRAVNIMLGASAEMQLPELPERIVTAARELLGAEICLLLRIDDATSATVIASKASADSVDSVDSVHSQKLGGLSLDLRSLPTILEAMQRREQCAVLAGNEHQELEALYRGLKLAAAGPAYLQPLVSDDKVDAALLAFMPSRLQAGLSAEQRALLGALGKLAANLLAGSAADSGAASLSQTEHLQTEQRQISPARQEEDMPAGDDSAELRDQFKQLSAEHDALLDLREQMRRDYQDLLARFEARGTDARALQERIQELQRLLEVGGQKRGDLERSISTLSGERDNLLRIRDQLTARLAEARSGSAEAADEAALRARLQELQATVAALIEERERLSLELGEARTAKDAASQDQSPGHEPVQGTASAKRLGELEQALALIRQMQDPLIAISDCTNMLLQESLGILGAAQLEVLRRVSENLAQLTTVLSAIMNLGVDEENSTALSYTEADIVDLLDEAITALATEFRQKQLALELAIEGGLPRVSLDKDGIKQVLRQLLQNACDVSAQGAPVFVSATLASRHSAVDNAPVEFLRISVEDRGGGIAEGDFARVFARKYLREYPKIAGLGASGVGMSLARAYARAHAGDLWIESKAGTGSVFHLDIPTRLMPSAGA